MSRVTQTSRFAALSTRKVQEGFTLLEVMVAVGILALSLTAIFSSQVGAMKVAERARKTNIATLLARCKMGELEEKIAKEGLPAISASDSDGCCEGGEQEGFRCEWKLERVILPDTDATEDTEDTEGDSEDQSSNEAPIAQKNPVEEAIHTDKPLDKTNPQDFLVGTSRPDDMVTDLAMQYVFPMLRTAFEEYVRRAQIRVFWQEGSREKSFEVNQFLVGELPPRGATSGETTPSITPSTTPGLPQ